MIYDNFDFDKILRRYTYSDFDKSSDFKLVRDNQTHTVTPMTFDNILSLVNELTAKVDYLEGELIKYQGFVLNIVEANDKLEDENKQLKQQLKEKVEE